MRFIRNLFIITFSAISLTAFAKLPKHVSSLYMDSTRVYAAHCNGTNEADCKKSREAFRIFYEGVKAYKNNDTETAIKGFNQAADYFKDLGETTDYITIKKTMGLMLAGMGKMEEAIMIAYEIRRMAESTNDIVGMAKFHSLIGYLYSQKKQENEAKKEYHIAYTIYKQLPESEKEFLTGEMAILNQNYGICCFDLKDYAQAEVLLASSLAFFWDDYSNPEYYH